jgi:hypothetical protein
MGHWYREQVRRGAIIVKISSYSVEGLALMALAKADEPDRFATKDARVVLVDNRRQVSRFATLGGVLTVEMQAVIAAPHIHHAGRRHSMIRTRNLLSMPREKWQWDGRGEMLGRLDMTWAIAESVGDSLALEHLKGKAPLGQIAELCYESLKSDEEYREALGEIDLEAARRDYGQISSRQDAALERIH